MSKSRLTEAGRPLRWVLVAQMAELVDAPASGAGARKGVEVRVLFWAPFPSLQTTTKVQKHPKKPAKAGFFVSGTSFQQSQALCRLVRSTDLAGNAVFSLRTRDFLRITEMAA